MTTFTVEKVANADGTIGRCEVVVDGGVIRAVNPLPAVRSARDRGREDTPVHAWAVPGFIDMHTHGAAGHDVMDGDRDGLAEIARHHLRHGTTSFLASTLTAPLETLERLLPLLRACMGKNAREAALGGAASLLGVHLEGPWVSPEKAGAQNTSYMQAPDERSARLIREYSDIIRMVTFSYHYPSAGEFLDLLLQHGIIAACGHDQTVDDRILEGFARGLRYVTHLYSMTSSFQRVNGLKHLGTLEMALMTPGVAVEVIADGRHITSHFWRFITHNKSYDDIIIVSDSMRWAGMREDPNRVIRLGDLEVIVDGGVAWLADRSAFAGSISTMHDMFVRLVREWGVSVNDAVRMTSWNQARQLRLQDRLGSIAPGRAADFLLLNGDLEITQVVKAGELVPAVPRPVEPGRSGPAPAGPGADG